MAKAGISRLRFQGLAWIAREAAGKLAELPDIMVELLDESFAVMTDLAQQDPQGAEKSL